MKKKTFLGTLLFTAALLLSACGSSNNEPKAPSNNNSNGESSNSKLELLYFGKIIDDGQPNTYSRVKARPYRLNEEPAAKDYNVEYNADSGLVLEAHVKNVDRLSFVDIVLFSAATGKKYVYTGGAGDYVVESSTVLDNDVWTTKLRFTWIPQDIWYVETDSCYFDTYVEIEEINFFTLNGAITRTDITNSDVRRVNVHATDRNDESHSWTSWETREQTCETYQGQYRHCTECNKEQSEIDWEKPPLGHDCDGWTIENKTPGILQQGDIFNSVGNCKRCNEAVSCVLPNLFISNFSLTIPNDVTSIGREAFWGSIGLTSVTIPTTVTSVGERAFGSCTNLKTFIFESANPPRIGSDLFSGTWDYDDFLIFVPNGSGDAYRRINSDLWQEYAVRHIVELGNGVTVDCNDGKGHEWIWTFDSSLTTIYSDSFIHQECAKCGAKMTSYALNDIKGRYGNPGSKVIIPEGVTKIESDAFSDCYFMSFVTLPSTLTYVGNEAFRYCSNIVSMEFNSQVPPTFDGRLLGDLNDEMKDIVIYVPCGYGEAYVTAITSNTWDNQYLSLASRIVGHKINNWTTTKEATCEEEGLQTGVCSVCNQEATLTIDALGHLYDYSTETEKYINTPCGQMRVRETTCIRCGHVRTEELSNLDHTWSWSFPSNVTAITRQSAIIRECTKCGSKVDTTLENELYLMTSIIIPNTVTLIGADAFSGAERLTTITIPSSVTSLGERAFSSCNSLLSVYFESQTPPQIGSDLFGGTWNNQEFKIYVPCGSSSAYKAVRADWWDLAISHIVENHSFGDWVVTKNPTGCTEAGEKQRTCSLCGETEIEVLDALGHDYVSSSGENNEYANLLVCSRCNDTLLNFKATDTSEASKSGLVFEETNGEQCARFWGRPIGNAVKLDEDGNADSNNHNPVFDENEMGNYFEFVFNLSEQQALILANCKLYCDAKPAAFLGGQDFWARRPSDEEWTPGYYIDDNPSTEANEKGTIINDYRYVLYVDDVLQSFDSSISVPALGSGFNSIRAEYVVPFDFHLHEGTNRISLHMAGGYRSSFYNFTFRPVSQ